MSFCKNIPNGSFRSYSPIVALFLRFSIDHWSFKYSILFPFWLMKDSFPVWYISSGKQCCFTIDEHSQRAWFLSLWLFLFFKRHGDFDKEFDTEFDLIEYCFDDEIKIFLGKKMLHLIYFVLSVIIRHAETLLFISRGFLSF